MLCLYKWTVLTQMDCAYTNGLCLHKWTVLTQMDYAYTNGLCLHKWTVLIHMDCAYTNETRSVLPVTNRPCINFQLQQTNAVNIQFNKEEAFI
jgi:hypothetical protein